jgi:hypothetical protein
MKAVWKYDVPVQDEFTIEMPEDAHVLTVQEQHGAPRLWALVDPKRPLRKWRFWLAGTGHMIPMPETLRHVGTFQAHGGDLVFHLFERVKGG